MNSVSIATNRVPFWRAQNWASASLSLISVVIWALCGIPTESLAFFRRLGEGRDPLPPYGSRMWVRLTKLAHRNSIKKRREHGGIRGAARHSCTWQQRLSLLPQPAHHLAGRLGPCERRRL